MELPVLVQCILEPIQTEPLVNEVDENICGQKEILSLVQYGMTMQNIVKQILFKVAVVLEKLAMTL